MNRGTPSPLQTALTYSSRFDFHPTVIGTSAANLMSAVLFIFVSRLYDVGDRVHIYDGSGTAGAEPMNVTVHKVDLRTTSFRRWDEQVGRVGPEWLEGRIPHENMYLRETRQIRDKLRTGAEPACGP